MTNPWKKLSESLRPGSGKETKSEPPVEVDLHIPVSQVFEADVYEALHGLSSGEGLAHFLREGSKAGLDPSPYFSTQFYHQRYPDWSEGGARTALEDFLSRLARGEMRQPHPLIDPEYYRTRYVDLEQLGARAALHFSEHGDHEVRSPSELFDADFYQRCYLKPGQRSPFRHFVRHGERAGNVTRDRRATFEESRSASQKQFQVLARPLLLCCHDAQLAGVPILTRDLACAAKRLGWQPVFLLKTGGPMLDELRALGPVYILAEGWALDGLTAGIPQSVPILANTSVVADIATRLTLSGHRCLILVHEMADYIRDQGVMTHLVSAQDVGVEIIASSPRMAEGLRPELADVEILPEGVVFPPTTLKAIRSVRSMVRSEGQPLVFIGAGHADKRKGFDLFLEAARTIAASTPSARFVWLGALDEWARALADEALGRGLDLLLPGFTSESLAWYRAADVYLLTSRQDPGPTTPVHAAAVGTPFVGYAYDIGIIERARRLGQFIPPGDVGAYCDAALAAAASVTPQSRRALRRYVREEAAFAPYVEEVLAKLVKLR